MPNAKDPFFRRARIWAGQPKAPAKVVRVYELTEFSSVVFGGYGDREVSSMKAAPLYYKP